MADAECIDLLEKERISKELKNRLFEWREIVVILYSLMAWEKIWFPMVTVAYISIFYMYIWLMNCSTLNLIWTTGLVLTLMDFFVSGPLQRLLPPSSWDQDKERVYSLVCGSVTDYYVTFRLYAERFFKLRQTNTRLFHSVLAVTFFSLLYVGITFNNLLVSYVTVLAILLFPGFKMRSEYIEDLLQKYLHSVLSRFWPNNDIMTSS
ncbi:ADP-ribosylation factor-like protein 6-interacting protein 1 [Daktulosphaira vitifoliae]|uniref:ADP-ribosylation factor-like protein 6-interacting protein 1 n=1 Tax=Daktulosphaira vitifoliae TaxID=58002 RepID=UPI0021A99DC5|nr:ADP-ribosylation factor-like protein 6-interacting protein 1 [Daktulosphaira vitifoliae]